MAFSPKPIASTIICLLIIVFSGAAHGDGAPDQCGAVLIPNIHIKSLSKRGLMAWMKLVNTSNYDSFRQEGSLEIPDYFSGDYNSFNEKRSKYFAQENYSSDDYEAQQELSLEVPTDNVKAWSNCVDAHSSGLFVYAKDVDEAGATLSVVWNPAPGIGQLSQVKVTLTGAALPNDFSKVTTINPGVAPFQFKRASNNSVVRGTIRGKAGENGAYGADFYIPAKLPPPPPEVVKPPPPAPEKLSALWVGQTANCNAAVVASHQNHLNCVNIPLGYTIKQGPAAQQLLYEGLTPFANAGYITTNISFRGGATQPWGYTMREDNKLPNSVALYVVTGCGTNDGEVTNNPHHLNCPTVLIGYAYPW